MTILKTSAVGTRAVKHFLVCHGKTSQCESKQFSLSCANYPEGERVLVAKNLHTPFIMWLAAMHLDTTSYVILLSPQLRNIFRVILNLKLNTTAKNSTFLKLIVRYRSLSGTVSCTRTGIETAPN
jgi:hypothetical protein